MRTVGKFQAIDITAQASTTTGKRVFSLDNFREDISLDGQLRPGKMVKLAWVSGTMMDWFRSRGEVRIDSCTRLHLEKKMYVGCDTIFLNMNYFYQRKFTNL